MKALNIQIAIKIYEYEAVSYTHLTQPTIA